MDGWMDGLAPFLGCVEGFLLAQHFNNKQLLSFFVRVSRLVQQG